MKVSLYQVDSKVLIAVSHEYNAHDYQCPIFFIAVTCEGGRLVREDDQLAHCSIYIYSQMKAFDKTVIIDGNKGSIRLGELDGEKCKMCL